MGLLDDMNFLALDENFEIVSIVEAYDSIIWTDKFNVPGDFEIHGSLNPQLLAIVESATYLYNTATKTLMVIEKPSTVYDEEDGNTLTITGRSLGSILDRRVLKTSFTVINPTDPRISQRIFKLVNEAFGPVDVKRYWDKLQIIDSTSLDSVVLPEDTALQFTMGDNLLEVVQNLCNAFDLGFRCELSVADRLAQFIIYEGEDRTTTSDFLIFSDLYDNLHSFKETISYDTAKNAILVIGNAQDPTTKIPLFPQFINSNSYTGINRREMFLQASQDITIYNADGTQSTMTNSQYITALLRAGTSELRKKEHKPIRDYDGEIIETVNCRYGRDFNLGDIVAFFLPHYSIATTARVDGITLSHDATEGKTLLPQFTFMG